MLWLSGRPSAAAGRMGGRHPPNSKPSLSATATTEKAVRDPRGGAGSRRLADAFEVAAHMPALAESRRRLLVACGRGGPSDTEITEIVETDVALTAAILRGAHDLAKAPPADGGVRAAVEALGAGTVGTIAAAIETYDPFASQNGTTAPLARERFRRHALTTRLAAERIGDAARLEGRDELAAAALLHDIGHLVMAELHDIAELGSGASAPDERVRRERIEFGIDHALVGGVLARRWNLSPNVAAAIERHHAPDALGHAAAVGLANLVAHYSNGSPIPPPVLLGAGAGLDLDAEKIAALVYEFPGSNGARKRATDPCPLSGREMDALRGLADGKVYKQIAAELSLSVSTIRTHLHNVYRKIGAVDRAQAVLIATERGWL